MRTMRSLEIFLHEHDAIELLEVSHLHMPQLVQERREVDGVGLDRPSLGDGDLEELKSSLDQGGGCSAEPFL
jgi:hypothetical protein